MSTESAPAPSISNCSHVAVIVNDMDEAFKFYTEVLGLKDLNTPQYVRDNGVCWLDLGGNLALHLVYGDVKIPEFWAHIALSVTDLKAWEERIRSHGMEIIPQDIALYNAERFFMKDPSGNRIELIEWNDTPEP